MSNRVFSPAESPIDRLIFNKWISNGRRGPMPGSMKWKWVPNPSPNFELQKVYRKQVIDRDGYACRFCGRVCYLRAPKVFRLTMDHVVPLVRGGMNHPSNMVVCCSQCNRFKADDLLGTGKSVDMALLPPRANDHKVIDWVFTRCREDQNSYDWLKFHLQMVCVDDETADRVLQEAGTA